jgi:hypothetical protein
VQTLAMLLRNCRRQHLAGQLLREAPGDIATARRARQDPSPFRFMKCRRQPFAIDLRDLFEQVRFEVMSEQRGSAQDVERRG